MGWLIVLNARYNSHKLMSSSAFSTVIRVAQVGADSSGQNPEIKVSTINVLQRCISKLASMRGASMGTALV